MNLLKKVVPRLLLVSLAFSLCGCALISDKIKYDTKDMNGEEDFSLAVFGDDDICAEENGSYCFVYGFSANGESSYENEDYWHDADETTATAVTPMSGVALVQMTYGKEDTIVFSVECARSAGNMRIVLLDEGYNIIYDFDVSGESSFEVTGAKGKTFEIRVAGESAEFEINVFRRFIS